MKRWYPALFLLSLPGFFLGCGKDKGEDWFSNPSRVIAGIMHAYEVRDDSLYAAFLADDFRYFFEPQGSDSTDVLGWGKEEEVVGTGSLFRTPDVESLKFHLDAGEPRAAKDPAKAGWVVVPISGGEMVISVRDKEPMSVTLNRQEIYLRPRSTGGSDHWEVVEWHDYPVPVPDEGG